MADEPTGGNGRINVSEDRLVRVVLESEIRLRDFIEKMLESKADLLLLNEARKDVALLKDRVTSLEKWRYGLGLLGTTALTVAGIVGHHSHLF